MSAQDTEADVSEQIRLFQNERSRLLRIAHRIVTDRQTAEDVVQETWIRWQSVDHHTVHNAGAFLTTTTTRIAVNVIQSARHRHESPVDLATLSGDRRSHLISQCLPGRSTAAMIVSSFWDDPTGSLDQRSGVESLIRVLMCRLTPAERAAWLLRRCFDYPYDSIARLLKINTANARQLVCRSRVRLGTGWDQSTEARSDWLQQVQTPSPVNRASVQRLVQAFVTAGRYGDLNGLESELTATVAANRSAA